jgi:uncharacterized protein YdhG (YjbR/CyaY superfamily)
MSAKKATAKATKSTTTKGKTSQVFTAEERDAMRERVKEMKSAVKGDGERDVLEKIAEMPEPDRAMGKKIHAIVKESAPSLSPKLWYGMPAYANQEGKVVCFFQSSAKFKSRYATFGFNDDAQLDEGAMWPTSYALTRLTATEEAKIAKLVKKAAS